jgi:hypothetical protein
MPRAPNAGRWAEMRSFLIQSRRLGAALARHALPAHRDHPPPAAGPFVTSPALLKELAAGADIIASGDRHLLGLGTHQGIRILRPAAVLASITGAPE